MAEIDNTVLFVKPFNSKSTEAWQSVKSVAKKVGLLAYCSGFPYENDGGIYETRYALANARIVVCDISTIHPNVMYEIGYVHGLKRPVILISSKPEHVPFDVRSVTTVYYGVSNTSIEEFEKSLESHIQEAMRDPKKYSHEPYRRDNIRSLFVSYCHRDREYLDRLLVHLKPLEKAGLVDIWEDSKIQVGDHWKGEIEKALQQARAAILLVSADFLSSDFIVENELPPILKRAESEGTRIIPLIVKPCRFARDKNLSQFQAINDPVEPMSGLDETGQEAIYDQVSKLVELFMGENAF